MPSLSTLTSDDVANQVPEVVALSEEEDGVEIYEQPPPGPALGERHSVDDSSLSSLTPEQKAEAARCLRLTTMFKFCSDESIMRVVEHMRREQFSEGEVSARAFFLLLFYFRFEIEVVELKSRARVVLRAAACGIVEGRGEGAYASKNW